MNGQYSLLVSKSFFLLDCFLGNLNQISSIHCNRSTYLIFSISKSPPSLPLFPLEFTERTGEVVPFPTDLISLIALFLLLSFLYILWLCHWWKPLVFPCSIIAIVDVSKYNLCSSLIWSRKWQPTPVFLPGEVRGQRSLVGYSPWGCRELDMVEHTHTSLLRNYWICH